MIESEILKEKYRVQKKLSEESSSVQDYLRRSHLAAEQVARSHGFRLQYAESLVSVSVKNRALHHKHVK